MIFLAIVVVSTASVVGGGIVVGGCDAVYAQRYARVCCEREKEKFE